MEVDKKEMFSEWHLAQTRHIHPIVGEPYDLKCACQNDLSKDWHCMVHALVSSYGKVWTTVPKEKTA